MTDLVNQPIFVPLAVKRARPKKKCCPSCGLVQQGLFPERVHAPTQYGDGFAAWTAYLHAYPLLPLERIAQLFKDLTGYRPSEATLLSYLKLTSESLQSAENAIRSQLLGEPVVHADETGLRVEGQGHWLHTISMGKWTLLGMHESRGSKAIDALGFLPRFTGAVVHDCYKSYFKEKYTFKHVLCNVHLLRDCQEIEQFDKHHWVTQMKDLLLKSWIQVKAARQVMNPLEPDVIEAIKAEYDAILEDGKLEWARMPSEKRRVREDGK